MIKIYKIVKRINILNYNYSFQVSKMVYQSSIYLMPFRYAQYFNKHHICSVVFIIFSIFKTNNNLIINFIHRNNIKYLNKYVSLHYNIKLCIAPSSTIKKVIYTNSMRNIYIRYYLDTVKINLNGTYLYKYTTHIRRLCI